MLYRFRWFMTAFSMTLAMVPFAGVVGAALVALVVGCEINDAAGIACQGFGIDLGPLLSSLLVSAELGEITFPILTAALMFWAAIESAALLFRR